MEWLEVSVLQLLLKGAGLTRVAFGALPVEQQKQ